MKTDLHIWFRAKQKLFANKELCPFVELFERSDRIIEYLFELRKHLIEAITSQNRSFFDTFCFFIDWHIEHLESINILTKIGLVNGASNLLRSIYITFAKISFLRRHPEECNNLRAGKSKGKFSDSSLLKSLEESNSNLDAGLYGQLSKAVHANFTIAWISQHARFAGQINPKHYLMAEGILLQAQEFCLKSAFEILRVLPNDGNLEILSLYDTHDSLNRQRISDCHVLAKRYEEVFGEKPNWGSIE